MEIKEAHIDKINALRIASICISRAEEMEI
jgi:hypothetical protein